MGRHRAPDPDEPADEPSDEFSEPHDVGEHGGYREPDGFPPAEPPGAGGFDSPRYPDHPAAAALPAAVVVSGSWPPPAWVH